MSNYDFYKSLGRCPDCPNESPVIHGDGPTPCSVVAIGEAPGGEEEASGAHDTGGRPFVGRAGREFNENYLPCSGLSRSEIYMTNSVKCRPKNNKTPSDALRASCSRHFITREIELVKPELVILMGATANKLLADPPVLERTHGYPFKVTEVESGVLGYSGWVVNMYHPAAGMHNTSMMKPLLEDWRTLGLWLRELWDPPVDDIPDRTYELVDDINHFTRTFTVGADTAVDTESDSAGDFWSAQYSQCPGTGYAIMARNSYLMRQFADACTESSKRRGLFIAQNALVDYLPLYNTYELRLDPMTIMDTMQLAFQHGNMPQGLKSMSYRLLGCKMTDFEDVVIPSSNMLLLDWLRDILIKDYKFKAPKMERMPDGSYKATATPGPRHKQIMTILNKAAAGGSSQLFKDASKFYAKYEIASKYHADAPPRMGIEHVRPFSVALHYMCQDPDMTLRCYYALINIANKRMQSHEFQKEVDDWRNLNLSATRVQFNL
jgi:DNA polymerase